MEKDEEGGRERWREKGWVGWSQSCGAASPPDHRVSRISEWLA